jgi:hypothetical protein
MLAIGGLLRQPVDIVLRFAMERMRSGTHGAVE